jgi:SAM-dependent methyltransferase
VQPYQKFADVYDRMEADHHSKQMVAYTLRLLKRLRRHPATGLDLCCGTGTAIELLLEHGLTMHGLDRSAAMIKAARKKLAGRGVTLHRQALPRFEIREKKDKKNKKASIKRFDLVTSYYDSLNYLLTERDLAAAFRSAHRHLAPGGLFVFDMNSPNALKTIWGAQTWAVSHKDIAWIFRNEYFHDTTTANCYVTIFVKEGRAWRRIDELHTERGYSNATIRKILRSVGFRVKGLYRCFTYEPATARTNRICVVAERVR